MDATALPVGSTRTAAKRAVVMGSSGKGGLGGRAGGSSAATPNGLSAARRDTEITGVSTRRRGGGPIGTGVGDGAGVEAIVGASNGAAAGVTIAAGAAVSVGAGAGAPAEGGAGVCAARAEA